MNAHSVECAGLNGCPDVEAHRVDSRLDPGVRAARRVEWDDPKQWDGDTLRPGWMEMKADAYHSGESIKDAVERHDTERDARDLSDIHGYHTLTKVICVTVCIGWWVFVIFAIGFMVGGRYA